VLVKYSTMEHEFVKQNKVERFVNVQPEYENLKCFN
jgi:hypothetical protein